MNSSDYDDFLMMFKDECSSSLPFFDFKKYDSKSKSHKKIIEEMFEEEVIKYQDPKYGICGYYKIINEKDNKIIGFTGLKMNDNIWKEINAIEISIRILKDFQSKGLAIYLFHDYEDYLFNFNNCLNLYFSTLVNNYLLEKIAKYFKYVHFADQNIKIFGNRKLDIKLFKKSKWDYLKNKKKHMQYNVDKYKINNDNEENFEKDDIMMNKKILNTFNKYYSLQKSYLS